MKKRKSTTNVVGGEKVQALLSPRARLIAETAVQVLGNQGSEGLTHRAVDREAGLPLGSTSNHFRTRAALMGAAGELLTERDLGQLRQAAGVLSQSPRPTLAAAASQLVTVIQRWANDDATYTCARVELFLQARRDPEVAATLARGRAEFLEFTRQWLGQFSEKAAGHAPALMAVVEGLNMIQLMHPATKLSDAALMEEVSLVLRAIVED